MAHHALVFGASGILGWAVVNEILNNYPRKGAYAKVTALTNRPLPQTFWPAAGPDVPELNLISGIDLSKGTAEEWRATFTEKIPDIATVDHVYYFAYQFHPDFPTEYQINVEMFKRGFGVIEALAPKLSYAILPTGTKGYGIHLPQRPFEAPFAESMGELPKPARDILFYYGLRDELTRLQRGKSWNWAEVRCDMVVGFVPNSNPYNIVALFTNFLSLYKYMHEKGHPAARSKRVSFPFPPPSYNAISTDGGQDIFARFSIHLCQQGGERAGNGELYNIADEATPRSFADRWPALCECFGLEGVGPDEGGEGFAKAAPVGFLREHPDQVEALERDKGVRLQEMPIGEGLEMWLHVFDFDHHLKLDKARSVGFAEEVPLRQMWKTAVERYARAGRAYLG
ncbi:hypothetical protein B0J12DRAFT_613154 [Macrophomina phaseolina]|uniref:PRISE-like Rossmann-fold domain-containing protein n=1 Tax=Macrophomina phaseolina TaxID=35725 RepID=A0ABQ8GV30_9PEZI|nr:hypothetical protein B0J12DRAFT_613154 [Macrophomina phaseolina]